MHERINIAIVGFGNIGSYFYKILEKNKLNISKKTGKIPFVKYISAKNINKKRLIKIPKTKKSRYHPLFVRFRQNETIRLF